MALQSVALLCLALLLPAESVGIAPAPGDLVITELLVDPQAVSDARGEYVEVANVSASPLQLLGLVLRDDGSDWCSVDRPLVVAPGARLLFARNLAPESNGGLFPAYPCTGHRLHLNNGRDAVVLDWYGTTVDEVAYEAGDWPIAPGRAMELDADCLDAALNDVPAAWAPAVAFLPMGDRGTPGW